MPRRKRKIDAPRPTKGRCHACDGLARGGSFRRRGLELVPICRDCGSKHERERYLTTRQAADLAAAAKFLGPRHELLVAVGTNLGLRISEIAALRGADFDWPESRVNIKTLKQKGHPERPVYMSRELCDYLQGLIGERRGVLFPRLRGGHGWKKGGAISRWTAERIFRAAAENAGLPPKISAHAMRHYAAIRTLEETGDLLFTQRQLRHASLRTTERYLHLLPERAASLAEKVPVTAGGAA